ncbi:MAG: hypothetical protein ACRDHE_05980, partial [Ktedonobacterales bacterium]
EATVSADGTLEIRAPELTPGQRVRVTIEPQPTAEERKPHAADILAGMSGHHIFKTAEEVDAYINEERDTWDR